MSSVTISAGERSGTRAELYGAFAEVARALGSGARLELLDLLAQGPCTVGELAADSGRSVANISQHLQILSGAGMVTAGRSGRNVVYRLASAEVHRVLSALRHHAVGAVPAVGALVDRHLPERGTVELISMAEFRRRLRARQVMIIDVRPQRDFDAGHLRGAVHVDPDGIANFVASISGEQEIIAYCRGHYCSFADHAVRALVARGYSASRLEDGFPELCDRAADLVVWPSDV